MKLKLSPHAFCRKYSKFVLFLNQVTHDELLFEDADWLTELFSRKFTSYDKLKKQLCKNRIFPEDAVDKELQDLCDILMASNMIVSDIVQEKNNLRVPDNYFASDEQSLQIESPSRIVERIFYENPTVFELSIDLTDSCNERCIHCYIPEYTNSFLDKNILFSLLDEFALNGGLKVKFSGGECMLHPDFIEILEYARKKDLIITVLSNLTCCSEEICAALKSNNVALVQTSIYSLSHEIHDEITGLKGSCARTLNAFEKLYNLNVPLQISCPLMRQNYSTISSIVDFGKKKNVRVNIDFQLMAQSNHCTDNLENRINDEQLFEFIHKYFYQEIKDAKSQADEKINENDVICEVGTSKICVAANGDFYPCNNASAYVLGNCYVDSLQKIWNESEKLKYLRNLRWKEFDKCIICPNKRFCKICPLKNFNETGSLTGQIAQQCKIASIMNETVL